MKTQQGIQNLTDAEAAQIISGDRESNQRDLYEAIENKDFPRWFMYVQVMSESDAEKVSYNPFDLTKVWPHADHPLIEVGMLELNRNAENYFQDIEQVAFAPAVIVPGIGFSPDKMLQGRLFSYGDAQRYRLGVNYAQIPVNAARCPVHTYHRDGALRVDGNGGGSTHYAPNSRGALEVQPGFAEPALAAGQVATRWNHREDTDYYSQPRRLFELMNQDERQRLFENTARAMRGASEPVKKRHVENCTKVHADYGSGVAEALARIG